MPFDNLNFKPEFEEPDLTLCILVRGRALIAKGWCQHDVCQDDNGDPTVSLSNATRFCSYGAVKRAVYDNRFNTLRVSIEDFVLNCLSRAAPWSSGCINYNDTRGRTHKEVLAMWDLAIQTRRYVLGYDKKPWLLVRVWRRIFA